MAKLKKAKKNPEPVRNYKASPDMEKLMVPIGDLSPDPNNARTHPERSIVALMESLDRFGYQKPVVATRDGVVHAGNGTVEAAQRLGWTHVPVSRTDLKGADLAAYAIADNRTGELSEWDSSLLGRSIDDIRVQIPDIDFKAMGFSDRDFRKLVGADESVVEDQAPEPLLEAVSKRGDLWVMGEHRLLCGDSTDGGDVAICMSGEKPDCLFTDPPYGVAYKAMRGGDPIANDEDSCSAHVVTLAALRESHAPPVAFVCCDWKSIGTIRSAMEESAMPPKACIVWDKLRGVQNLDRYYKRHELILYFGPYGGEKTVDGDVWQFPRDFVPDHPTPKPVGLIAHAIETTDSRLVYDPFSGSGTTIIACEQLNRRCFAIEIEPRYVDVCVRRWEKLTGKSATLDGDGRTFDEIATERLAPPKKKPSKAKA